MEIDKKLAELVNDIDKMVEAASMSPDLKDADLRRVLGFISQVIQVVEQAFQDVLALLIELKYLEDSDLKGSKINEIRMRIELLTSRSYYRDAAEICSRLKHLNDNFQQFISPLIKNIPEITGWHGIFNLLQHQEGRIIMLVEQTANQLSSILNTIDSNTLSNVKFTSSQYADQLKSLLKELHNLNGSILGFSGQAGFLELTNNRNELKKEVKIMIDKRDQSIVHGHKVQIGNGNVFNSNFTISNSIQDSFNQVTNSNASDELKQKLDMLCKQIADLSNTLPSDKQKELSQDLSTFITEATKEKPRKQWYELSAEGLISAAKTCGEIATPVIATVKSILTFLSLTL